MSTIHTPIFKCRHCGADACYVIVDGDYVFSRVNVNCHVCDRTNTVRLVVEQVSP